ncbi:NADPH-dependent FMN reductase [Niallia sp. FSL M8-0099]|uniref:NADPH-dependent FMN reductase n=1 Tax=Niallia sp. FSL M8-0099 TaxID=2954519 RepID=UPI0030F5A739
MTINVKAIIGSTSSKSYNLKLVRWLKKYYSDRLEINPVFVNNLEMFSVDYKKHRIPENVKIFKETIKNSDALLFAVPEYNFSISGALKNAIDWLSYDDELIVKGKPGLIIGSSTGILGSVRAQIHLREILSNPSLAINLMPGNEVYIGRVHEKINETGELTDKSTKKFLDTVINNFIEFNNK